jgi:hypothetical protein
MLESDFEEVQFLLKLKKKLTAQAKKCRELKTVYDNHVDSGGYENFNKGCSNYIHTNYDGSGSGVDLSGCYLGEQVASAVEQIIYLQLEDVSTRLKALKVTEEE